METEECLEILLSHIHEKKITKKVRIENAYGMISAEDVYSKMSVPPYPKAAVDGYAVSSEDIKEAASQEPAVLKVVGELDAGDSEEYPYFKNNAVRIMTGAYVPKGYNTVVRQEDTDYGEDNVKIYCQSKPYNNYCHIGEDIKNGDLILRKYDYINHFSIGVLASTGISEISVIEPAKIAIISTGSELELPGVLLSKGKIYSSITYMLSAVIESQGLEVVSNQICADDEIIFKEKLLNAAESADFIITTGGVSVGKRDIVPRVIREIGAQILFKRARIQPGTPTMASVYNSKVILSLSGNPYAAMANFELYFWSAMSKFMNNPGLDTIKKTAVLDSDYNKVNRVKRRIRAYEENGKVRIPSDNNKSSVISNMTLCNCFIDLESGRKVNRGDEVSIVYFK